MNTKLITNASKLLLLTLVAGLFAGCAATRPISDVALGAGGAYLGHELSDGDPLMAAAGAAGGVIGSETHDLQNGSCSTCQAEEVIGVMGHGFADWSGRGSPTG